MKRTQKVFAAVLPMLMVCALGGQGALAQRRISSRGGDDSKIVPLVKTDMDVVAWLDKAQKRIEEKNYSRAIEILQAIIEGDSGFVASEDDAGHFIAMRVAATDLIGNLPPEGRDLYRQLYNVRAERKFADARAEGNLQGMEDVAITYLHTPAGQQALETLGAMYFDRGRFLQAAYYWQRWLKQAQQADRPLLLSKTATALHFAGREEQARELLEELRKQAPEATAKLGGQEQNLLAFTEALLQREAMARSGVRTLEGVYPGWGGIADGMAIMDRCQFVLLPQWQTQPAETGTPLAEQLIARDVIENMGAQQGRKLEAHVQLHNGHVVIPKDITNRSRAASNLQPLPAVIRPVVTDRWVIYRGDDRVVALDRETGMLAWDTWEMLPIERAQESSDNDRHRYYGHSAPIFVDQGRYGLTVGGGYVYTIWDFPFDDPDPSGQMTPPGKEASSLTALELEREGYAAWTVGYSGQEEALTDALFVSLPTYHRTGPNSGRLYAVVMQTETYALVCLDPHDRGKLIWKVDIAQVPAVQAGGQFSHIDRMTKVGTPPAVAEGRVYVTTNAGVIAAFDAETGKSFWAHQYETGLNPGAGHHPHMMMVVHANGEPHSRVNPILVSGGLVIVMPADAKQIIALDAQDGSGVWEYDIAQPGLDTVAPLDADRLLLCGQQVNVLRLGDGKILQKLTNVKAQAGRPAVTPESVYLSGDGGVYQIDKADYSVRFMAQAESTGLLGNLVSADGQLFAANALGMSCYSSYDLARERLSERIGQAEPLVQAELQFQRGHLAFVAKDYDQALADFQACREIADGLDDLQRQTFLTQLRPRLYRAYVALGNVTRDRDERLERFQQAAELAETPLEKAHMLIRLARHYEDVGKFSKAIQLARQVRNEHGDFRLTDVKIGPNADTSVNAADVSTTHYGEQWAREYIGRLLSVHGQQIYAPYDAKARDAIDQALAADNPVALMDVAEAYPHSRHLPEARFRAAELYFNEARQRTGRAANDRLGKARSILLSSLATLDDPQERASAVVGLAAVDIAAGVPQSARRNLAAISNVPQDLHVSFGPYEGNVGDVIEQLKQASERPPEASGSSRLPDLPVQLGQLASFDDKNALIVTDNHLRPIVADETAFVLRKGSLEFWPLDEVAAEGSYDPRSVEVDLDPDAMGDARYNATGVWAAGLSDDARHLALTDGRVLVIVDLSNARVQSRLNIGQAIAAGVGESHLLALEATGTIRAFDLAAGREVWQSRIRLPKSSALDRPAWLIDAGVAVLRSDSMRQVHIFDIETGKLIFRDRANVHADVLFTPDDKLLLAIDETITLREPAAGEIVEPLAQRTVRTHTAVSLIAADTEIMVLAPSRDVPEFVSVAIEDLPNAAFTPLRPRPLPTGEAVYPVAATIDGQGIYVLSALARHSAKPAMPWEYASGVHLTRFDPSSGSFQWDRVLVSHVESAQRIMPPVHAAGCLVIGAIGARPDDSSGWFIVDKSNQADPIEMRLPAHNPHDRSAARRRGQLGAAVVMPGRLMVELPNGPAIYGETQ